MAQAKHDDNNVTSALAWDNTNSVPAYLKVDPVTNRLLIDVTLVPAWTPVVPTNIKHDENDIPVTCATTDNASATEVPVLIDASTNYLLIDLILG